MIHFGPFGLLYWSKMPLDKMISAIVKSLRGCLKRQMVKNKHLNGIGGVKLPGTRSNGGIQSTK